MTEKVTTVVELLFQWWINVIINSKALYSNYFIKQF